MCKNRKKAESKTLTPGRRTKAVMPIMHFHQNVFVLKPHLYQKYDNTKKDIHNYCMNMVLVAVRQVLDLDRLQKAGIR